MFDFHKAFDRGVLFTTITLLVPRFILGWGFSSLDQQTLLTLLNDLPDMHKDKVSLSIKQPYKTNLLLFTI